MAECREKPGPAECARLRAADPAKVRLGRYPFLAGIKYFVAKNEPYMSPTTIYENTKKLRYFAEVFERLKAEGALDTTDPRRFGELHFSEFFLWMRRKGLSVTTQTKYYQTLKTYLMTWQNTTFADLKLKGIVRTPRNEKSKPIKALTVEEVRTIFAAADRMKGWGGIMIRGYIALAFGTACRPKEIILAPEKDLDLEKRRFYIRHPKGEGSWAEPQWIGIVREDMVRKLECFMEERAEYMAANGLRSDFLFFNKKTGDHYTLNGFHMMKARIEKATGIEFALKDFRSTFCSIMISGNLALLKPVSLQLRHSSVKTTEMFYAKICESSEISAAIGDVWKDSAID